MPLKLRPLAAGGALLLAAAVACAQSGDKPELTLSADTMKMTIPGLENIKLPPQAQAALGGSGFGSAQRSLSVTLMKPGAPPESPTASLDIPEVLKLGPKLDLQVNQPAKPGVEGDPALPGGIPDFVLNRYWGCSQTVRPGQPKVTSTKDLAPGIAAGLARSGRGARVNGGRPNWTDAYWPNGKNPAQNRIQETAALPGKYALHSNFVPGVQFEIPAGVTFLEPVSLTLPQGADALDRSVEVAWKPVAGALGYVAMATGMKQPKTMIMWTSAESEDGIAAAYGADGDPKAQVAKGILLPPDRTKCYIPEAIFKGCQGVSVQLIAIGPSFTQAGTPAVKVHTRSTGMSMLGFPGGFGGAGKPGDDN